MADTHLCGPGCDATCTWSKAQPPADLSPFGRVRQLERDASVDPRCTCEPRRAEYPLGMHRTGCPTRTERFRPPTVTLERDLVEAAIRDLRDACAVSPETGMEWASVHDVMNVAERLERAIQEARRG